MTVTSSEMRMRSTGGWSLTLTSMCRKKTKKLFKLTRKKHLWLLHIENEIQQKYIDTFGNSLGDERSLNYFTIDAHKIHYMTIELSSLILGYQSRSECPRGSHKVLSTTLNLVVYHRLIEQAVVQR